LEALWGTRVLPSTTVSELNKRIYRTIEAWHSRPIEGQHLYIYLDGIVLKQLGRRGPQRVSSEGDREILGM
jgi:putative transposase